jgi:glucose-1-phosphate thymidylyltransferase
MARQGILLAGGTGSRLFPMTLAVSKQLLPVYDKPMVYYPLSVLMLAGIRDILVISTPTELPRFRTLLQDGSQWGLHLCYAAQYAPHGIAEALLIARGMGAEGPVTLILGDNLFYGDGLAAVLQRVSAQRYGATIFGSWVEDPTRYGVITLDARGAPTALEEKPAQPHSHYAIPGLYAYDARVWEFAAQVQPSARGELEITDVNRLYLEAGLLRVERLGRGMVWLDMGTPLALAQAASLLAALESRQGLKIGCPEEAAYRMGYIDANQLTRLATPLVASGYGTYLLRLLEEEPPVCTSP